ncbi:MAG: type III PLP-dependent enzyme domain-containing protein, partial [Deferrisomatales bacterium]
MPMSATFQARLSPILEGVAEQFGTPFHLYDEQGIRDTGAALQAAFAGVPSFREFFAVKALPNPAILAIMRDLGFGFDCSSIPELLLSRRAGGRGDDLMFTSNNTSAEEFEAALAEGAVLNLDDLTFVPKVPRMPERVCFRYNPGPRRTGNSIIGNPVEAKYGVSHEQVVDAYRQARERGAKRFGLHTMVCSNELNYEYMVETVRMLLGVVRLVSAELGLRFEFVNMGGGLGIPYRPEQRPLDLHRLGAEAAALLREF